MEKITNSQTSSLVGKESLPGQDIKTFNRSAAENFEEGALQDKESRKKIDEFNAKKVEDAIIEVRGERDVVNLPNEKGGKTTMDWGTEVASEAETEKIKQDIAEISKKVEMSESKPKTSWWKKFSFWK